MLINGSHKKSSHWLHEKVGIPLFIGGLWGCPSPGRRQIRLSPACFPSRCGIKSKCCPLVSAHRLDCSCRPRIFQMRVSLANPSQRSSPRQRTQRRAQHLPRLHSSLLPPLLSQSWAPPWPFSRDRRTRVRCPRCLPESLPLHGFQRFPQGRGALEGGADSGCCCGCCGCDANAVEEEEEEKRPPPPPLLLRCPLSSAGLRCAAAPRVGARRFPPEGVLAGGGWTSRNQGKIAGKDGSLRGRGRSRVVSRQKEAAPEESGMQKVDLPSSAGSKITSYKESENEMQVYKFQLVLQPMAVPN
ncbi:5-hydroxytryptamine receptor 1E isoform X2 [Hemicordylus capensis]|uniref:5-hydroxytryptamine receptor 1E isoform X2 n=1 Tax=Hemicordylus capensis TaxID=884348 RepID=UPI002303774F|nr:5-hydroxytryptamine receptor 1E isoform X2 [Hemicordylus capensis]